MRVLPAACALVGPCLSVFRVDNVLGHCTFGDEQCSQAGSSAEQKGASQGPPPAPAVHGDPSKRVAGDFHETDEAEVQELVAAQTCRVHGQTVVDKRVGSPE